jgi:hypothetical protein
MDPSTVPWPLIGYGSAWGLVGLFVWLIYTGRLVPRTTLDDSHHDANEWRAESRIKDAQLAEKDVQLRHMAEVGKTVDSIMRSIQRNALSGDRQSAEEAP